MRSLRKLSISSLLILAVLSFSSFSEVNPDRENPNDKPVKATSAEYCVFLGVFGEMILIRKSLLLETLKEQVVLQKNMGKVNSIHHTSKVKRLQMRRCKII